MSNIEIKFVDEKTLELTVEQPTENGTMYLKFGMESATPEEAMADFQDWLSFMKLSKVDSKGRPLHNPKPIQIEVDDKTNRINRTLPVPYLHENDQRVKKQLKGLTHVYNIERRYTDQFKQQHVITIGRVYINPQTKLYTSSVQCDCSTKCRYYSVRAISYEELAEGLFVRRDTVPVKKQPKAS